MLTTLIASAPATAQAAHPITMYWYAQANDSGGHDHIFRMEVMESGYPSEVGWVIFGDQYSNGTPTGSSSLNNYSLLTSPVGPWTDLTTSSGGHNGPTLGYVLDRWLPSGIGDSLNWAVHASNLPGPTSMYWSHLQGSGPNANFESIVWGSEPFDQDGDGLLYYFEDCDDTDANVGANPIWYADADGDGAGDASSPLAQCERPEGFVSNADDCDDGDAQNFPGNEEVCDGSDNDCDGAADNGLEELTSYLDADGDGYGSGDATVSCDVPDDYTEASGDCDDNNAAINPDAAEVCDGVDNNCSGSADDGLEFYTVYQDSDGDSFGDTATSDSVCSDVAGWVSQDGDCDDSDGEINPDAEEVCDGVDNDCSGSADDGLEFYTVYQDSDGDSFGDTATSDSVCSDVAGWVSQDGDCDDSDGAINPEAPETCDSVDQDCDTAVDEGTLSSWYLDGDEDGFGNPAEGTEACSAPDGHVANGSDCDDDDQAIFPGAEEVCDDADQDCDTLIDEGALLSFYDDADGDGYGDPDTEALACAPDDDQVDNDGDCDDDNPEINPDGDDICTDDIDQDCSGSPRGCDTSDADGDGYSEADGDCDDDDATIYPGADDTPYDGIDQDCDSGDLTDVDGDGFDGGDEGDDCDDEDGSAYPGATEVCEGGGDDAADNDCDGAVDEKDADEDEDRDEACGGTDCDDSNPDVNGTADEIEDGIDNDCDNIVDEGTSDFDDDGDGYSEDDGDCDDDDATVNPGAEELPGDGIDNNCDGSIDEGAETPTQEPGTPAPETPTAGETATPTAGETDPPIDTPTAGETDPPIDTPTAGETHTPTVTEGTPPEGSPTEAGVTPTMGDPIGNETDTPTNGGGDDGCACSTGQPAGSALGTLLILLAGLAVRRRR